jgi:hypothetical protein
MTSTYDDPAARVRALAATFTAAIGEHLSAVEARRGEADATVYAAYERLRVAFTAYEDALYEVYDEVTPLDVGDDDDDDDDDDLDDDDLDEVDTDDDLDEDDEDDLDDDDDLDEDEDEDDLEDDDLFTPLR